MGYLKCDHKNSYKHINSWLDFINVITLWDHTNRKQVRKELQSCKKWLNAIPILFAWKEWWTMPPLILLRNKIKGLTDYEINQFNRDPDDKSQRYGVIM